MAGAKYQTRGDGMGRYGKIGREEAMTRRIECDGGIVS